MICLAHLDGDFGNKSILRPRLLSILAFDWSIAGCLNPIVYASKAHSVRKQNGVVEKCTRDYTAIGRLC